MSLALLPSSSSSLDLSHYESRLEDIERRRQMHLMATRELSSSLARRFMGKPWAQPRQSVSPDEPSSPIGPTPTLVSLENLDGHKQNSQIETLVQNVQNSVPLILEPTQQEQVADADVAVKKTIKKKSMSKTLSSESQESLEGSPGDPAKPKKKLQKSLSLNSTDTEESDLKAKKKTIAVVDSAIPEEDDQTKLKKKKVLKSDSAEISEASKETSDSPRKRLTKTSLSQEDLLSSTSTSKLKKPASRKKDSDSDSSLSLADPAESVPLTPIITASTSVTEEDSTTKRKKSISLKKELDSEHANGTSAGSPTSATPPTLLLTPSLDPVETGTKLKKEKSRSLKSLEIAELKVTTKDLPPDTTTPLTSSPSTMNDEEKAAEREKRKQDREQKRAVRRDDIAGAVKFASLK